MLFRSPDVRERAPIRLQEAPVEDERGQRQHHRGDRRAERANLSAQDVEEKQVADYRERSEGEEEQCPEEWLAAHGREGSRTPPRAHRAPIHLAPSSTLPRLHRAAGREFARLEARFMQNQPVGLARWSVRIVNH